MLVCRSAGGHDRQRGLVRDFSAHPSTACVWCEVRDESGMVLRRPGAGVFSFVCFCLH